MCLAWLPAKTPDIIRSSSKTSLLLNQFHSMDWFLVLDSIFNQIKAKVLTVGSFVPSKHDIWRNKFLFGMLDNCFEDMLNHADYLIKCWP